jgi:enamidase
MSVCGPFFTAPGGHPVSTFVTDHPSWPEEATRQVTDPEIAREEVRLLGEAGVDFIKVVLSSCPWPYRDPSPRLDSEVFLAIVEEAQGLGLPVAVHTDTPEDVTEAVTAGAYSIEHGVTTGELDEDLAALIAETGAYYVPTMTWTPGYSSSTVADLVDRISLLREAGARVAVGTDAAVSSTVWGTTLYRELRYMIRAGYEPMDALMAATAVNAEMLGWSDRLGTIEPGKLANLIAVEGDPLEDIAALREVRLVVLNGVVVRSSGD